MCLMQEKCMGTYLENFDAMSCYGSSLLTKEMVYSLQVEVDSSIVVFVGRKRL